MPKRKSELPKENVPALSPKEKIGLTIKDAMQLSSLGETMLYRAIKDGKLRMRKYGTRSVIMRTDLTAFMENLPDAK